MDAPDAGWFEWKRRMGSHEAFHQSRANRVVHWLCIPFELWSVVTVLSCAGPLDLLTILAVAPIYVLAEPLLGAVMVAFLVGCAASARALFAGHVGVAALTGVALFAVTFTAQVAVGHNVYEDGRDDTSRNLGELRRTWNPIPIVLVFWYHLVELAFHAGYRPALRADVDEFTRRERETWLA